MVCGQVESEDADCQSDQVEEKVPVVVHPDAVADGPLSASKLLSRVAWGPWRDVEMALTGHA